MLAISPNNIKYKPTGKSRQFMGRTLWQICNVTTGEDGGWIEHECNLSFFDSCWVSGEGIVCGNGVVKENAIVYGGMVTGGEVGGCASVLGGTIDGGCIYGHAIVAEEVPSEDSTCIDGGVIYGHAVITGGHIVSGFISGCARIAGGIVGGASYIVGGKIISGTIVKDQARVLGGVHNNFQTIRSFAYSE